METNKSCGTHTTSSIMGTEYVQEKILLGHDTSECAAPHDLRFICIIRQ